MTIRLETPCDHGPCPYEAEYWRDCEYWCGAEEPEDTPAEWLYVDTFEDAADEAEYEEPPVYVCEVYPDD